MSPKRLSRSDEIGSRCMGWGAERVEKKNLLRRKRVSVTSIATKLLTCQPCFFAIV